MEIVVLWRRKPENTTAAPAAASGAHPHETGGSSRSPLASSDDLSPLQNGRLLA
jgi:hypothetical protein